MEDVKKIKIEISVNELVEEVLNSNPKSECEYNNLLLMKFLGVTLNNIDNHLTGGRSMPILHKNKVKNKTKSKRTKTGKQIKMSKRIKYIKTRKTRVKQKGGTNLRLIIFFISFAFLVVRGMKNVSHDEVIRQVKDSYDVANIYQNYYGTCTLNTLLFLKSIDLPTFDSLSRAIIREREGLSLDEMSFLLNKKIVLTTDWLNLKGTEGEEDIVAESYIEKLRSFMINVRIKYGFRQNQDLLSAMIYPSKKIIQEGSVKTVDHAVILWLTNNDELIIIDPQVFYQKNNIILYSSNSEVSYLDDDRSLMLRPIKEYVKGNIDILDPERETNVLESLHIETENTGDYVKLSKTNQKLIETISSLRHYEREVDKRLLKPGNLRGTRPDLTEIDSQVIERNHSLRRRAITDI
jgi:hypothetical protein